VIRSALSSLNYSSLFFNAGPLTGFKIRACKLSTIGTHVPRKVDDLRKASSGLEIEIFLQKGKNVKRGNS
jgi:hypothetical protein